MMSPDFQALEKSAAIDGRSKGTMKIKPTMFLAFAAIAVFTSVLVGSESSGKIDDWMEYLSDIENDFCLVDFVASLDNIEGTVHFYTVSENYLCRILKCC